MEFKLRYNTFYNILHFYCAIYVFMRQLNRMHDGMYIHKFAQWKKREGKRTHTKRNDNSFNVKMPAFFLFNHEIFRFFFFSFCKFKTISYKLCISVYLLWVDVNDFVLFVSFVCYDLTSLRFHWISNQQRQQHTQFTRYYASDDTLFFCCC